MAEITAALTLDAGPAKATTDQFGASALNAARAVDTLSASQKELVARSERVAALANTIDIQNKKDVQSYMEKVATVRALAQQMGILDIVEQRTARAAQEATSFTAAYNQQLKALQQGSREAAAAVDYQSRKMALLQSQALAMDAAMGQNVATHKSLGAAAGVSDGRLNSLRSSMTSLAASMVGAAPGVAQFTGVLGTMAIGTGWMIAILAGVAALGFAWDKLTESVRKSKEEHEKAIKVLDELREKQDQGPAGEIGKASALRAKDFADQHAEVLRLQQELSNLPTAKPNAAFDPFLADRIRLQQRLDEARRAEQVIHDDMARGNAESARLVHEDASQRQQADASALEARLAFNQKDAAARRAALALLAKDQKDYADLLKKPFTADNSKEIARLASEMKGLNEAMNPKDKNGARDASRARTISNIAEQEERRVDAAKALDAAAQRGQAAYDKELHTQELKNKLLETEQRIRAQFLDDKGKQKPGSEGAMQAEIDRAREAVQAQDELGQHTRAALDIAKDESVLAALKAKQDAYDGLTGTVKDATVEQEHAVRVSEAMAIADDFQRAKKLALADAIRDQAYATSAAADAAAKQKRAEEEAARATEQRWRQLQRTLSSTINTFFTDLLTRGKSIFQSLWDSAKAGFFRMYSDILAAKLVEKFKEAMGVGESAAAKRNETAGNTMNEASKRFMDAARVMAGLPPLYGTGAPAKTEEPGWLAKLEAKLPSWLQSAIEKVKQYAAPAIAGFGAGYGVGESVYSTSHGTLGNYARGALGGAAAGALAGSAFGPVGAAVGAVAGFVGGILGVSNASKEAAKQTAELRKQLELNMDALRATVNHDDLGQAIAQANAQRETLRKQIEDAYSGGGRNSDTVKERNRQLAEMNALEDKYIAQLKEEAAAKSQYFSEDLQVEQMRANATIAESQGRTAEAAQLRKDADRRAYNDEQERRLDEYKRTHNMDDAANQAQYAQLQNTVALNEQAYALQQNTKAITDLTTTIHNAPSGFKYQQYAYDFAVPKMMGTGLTPPVNPFRPPTTPLNPPTLSRNPATSSTSKSITLNFNVDGTKGSRALATEVARQFKKVAVEVLGSEADPADAIELLAP
jgi:hypothetical protein